MVALTRANSLGQSMNSLERGLQQLLLAARNPDGGWCHERGRKSRLEPTCWALLALRASGSKFDRVLAEWPSNGATDDVWSQPVFSSCRDQTWGARERAFVRRSGARCVQTGQITAVRRLPERESAVGTDAALYRALIDSRHRNWRRSLVRAGDIAGLPRSGQDIIEYVLLAAFISVVAWTIIQSIGNDVYTLYTRTQSVTGAAASAS